MTKKIKPRKGRITYKELLSMWIMTNKKHSTFLVSEIICLSDFAKWLDAQKERRRNDRTKTATARQGRA